VDVALIAVLMAGVAVTGWQRPPLFRILRIFSLTAISHFAKLGHADHQAFDHPESL
jgi:hypothetical protein